MVRLGGVGRLGRVGKLGGVRRLSGVRRLGKQVERRSFGIQCVY